MQHLRLWSLTAVVILTACNALAQTSQGTIAGTVTDPTGASVVGASVTAKNTLGSDTRTVTTGSNGEYRIDAVTPSTYNLTVTASGFSIKQLANLQVPASVVTSVNVALEIGSISQTVSVEATAATIQTESGDLSGTVTTAEIRDLPIVTGNPIDLVLTQPGVMPVGNRDSYTNGEGVSVNGLRPRANNFLLDGFDNNDYGIQGQALQPSILEAVKEVNIQTNAYAPEFGRGGASVTNVIYKNGTNQFHGTAWERYAASALTAIPVELKNEGITTTPQFVNNEYGFDVGGPVVKNKLFLFGASQWNHTNSAESGATLTIPTVNGVAALKSIAATNNNIQIMLDSLSGLAAPEAGATGTINVGNRPGCGSPCLIEVGNEIRSPSAIGRSYEYVIRGDYAVSETDTITGRFIGTHSALTPDLFANGGALPSQDTFQGGPARNFGSYWTHVFSPTQVNELRFTAQQISFLFGPLASTLASPTINDPNISVAGLGSTYGGLNPTFPQGRAHDVFGYQDAYSWSMGTHSIKIGADMTHVSVTDSIPFNSLGTVSFVSGGDCSAIGLAKCTGLANYIDNFTGPSGSAGKQFGTPHLSFPQTLQAYYFQDTWKMHSNLTLTYGVRYEYDGVPLNAIPYPAILPGAAGTTQPELQRIEQKPDRNNFGPRVGLAYTPHFWKGIFGEDKTVFRMGAGMFYDVLFTNIGDNNASTAPNALGGTLTSPSTGRGNAGALQLVPAVTAKLNPLSTIDSVVSNIQNPKTYQWNFNIERQLPGGFLLTTAYVGSRGQDLYLNEELNPGIDGVRINPLRGSMLVRTNLGQSSYHGLNVEADRRFSHGFLFRAAYTYGKSLDNGSEVFTTSGGSTRAQDMFNYNLEKGPSAFDHRQRAVFAWVYDVPGFKTSSPSAKLLSWPLRDWEVSGILSMQTGSPETVYIGGYDQNGDTNAFNDRPSLGNPNAPINLSDACVNNIGGCITGIGQVNPDGSLVDWWTGAPGTASQFRYIVTNVLGTGPNGNVGRNTLVNPGRIDFNMNLTRVIKLPWEGKQLEFRADAFNVFNHPNAGGGASIDGSPVEGGVGGISGDINSTTFLNKSVTMVGGRSLQLWLKFRF